MNDGEVTVRKCTSLKIPPTNNNVGNKCCEQDRLGVRL